MTYLLFFKQLIHSIQVLTCMATLTMTSAVLHDNV